MYYWIINVCDIQWIEFKAKIKDYKLMKLTKFYSLVLMTKYIS